MDFVVRPGSVEWHQFKSTTKEKNEDSNLLLDNEGLVGFCKLLRFTFLDDLLMFWDVIMTGGMSFIIA